MVARGAGGSAAGLPRRVLRVAGHGHHRPGPAPRRRVEPLGHRRRRHRPGHPPGRLVHPVAGRVVDGAVRRRRPARCGAVRPLPVRRQTVPVGGAAGAVRAADRRRGCRPAGGVRPQRGQPGRSLGHHLGDPRRPRVLQLRRRGAHRRRGVVHPRPAGRGGRPHPRGVTVAGVRRGHPAAAPPGHRLGRVDRLPLHLHLVRGGAHPRRHPPAHHRGRDLRPDRPVPAPRRRRRPGPRAAGGGGAGAGVVRAHPAAPGAGARPAPRLGDGASADGLAGPFVRGRQPGLHGGAVRSTAGGARGQVVLARPTAGASPTTRPSTRRGAAPPRSSPRSTPSATRCCSPPAPR